LVRTWRRARKKRRKGRRLEREAVGGVRKIMRA
jgi:hypothetical protein